MLFGFVLLVISANLPAQSFNNLTIGYQGLALVYNGEFQSFSLSDDLIFIRDKPLYFQGVVISATSYNNWSYFNMSFSWNGTKFSNRTIEEPLDLTTIRLKVNNLSYDFGYNWTRKKMILTTGIGMSFTRLKEKKWQYERTSSLLDTTRTLKTDNYTFKKVNVVKERAYTLRAFLNIMIPSTNKLNRTINLKCFVDAPIFENGETFDIFFIGANLSVGILNKK